MSLKSNLMMSFVKIAYASILRDLLIKAIDDPNETWDNAVLKICDGIFMFTPSDVENK